MSLAAGTRIGSFQVIEPIGAGGMGEVYRARDTRLGRDVALKILPTAFALDPERLARFEREARMLASLNHPRIAQVHGFEEAAAPNGEAPMHALIMELVEGEDLAHTIARGPIPTPEAIAIAADIADALDAAHAIGIIHRDLKPGNVRIRRDGGVKLLDFGLAKPNEGSGLFNEALDNSPTISSPAITNRGVILGTAAYMAPEQAKGKVVDKRVDVWALGVVLYEMLSGRRPFRGSDSTEIIAQILERDPDWTALPRDTPPHVRRLLQRCLEKDRRRRMRDCGDVMLELAEPVTGPEVSATPNHAIRLVLVAVACLVIGAAAVFLSGVMGPAPPGPSPRVARFALIPSTDPLGSGGKLPIAISRDGRRVVYAGAQQLLVRGVDELSPRAISGTEPVATPAGARGNTGFAVQPLLSPDGGSVAYQQGLEMRRVSIAGGVPSVICTCIMDYGASWADDDSILFGIRGGDHSGVWRVPAAGGTPELIAPVEAGRIPMLPQLLPGGTHVLFTITHGEHWNESDVVVQAVKGGERRVLVEGGIDGRYVTSGHLLYGKDGVIYAIKFDPSSLKVSGNATPVLSGVAQQTSAGAWGGFAYAVAQDGTIVYVTAESAALRRVLVWVDRTGHEEKLPAEPRAYQYPRLSRDGQRVVLDMRDQQNDVWSWDLARATLTRVTQGRFAGGPAIWNRAGDGIFFGPDVDGLVNLHLQSTNGGTPRRLSTSNNMQFVEDLTPDGQGLVFAERDVKTGFNLRLLRLDGSSQPTDLIATPFNELNSDVSPDGRWIAYQSDESGRNEVYVRPFPDVNRGRVQVSAIGGTRPLWSRDGRELFFLDAVRRMNVVAVQQGPAVSFGTPRVLFDTASFGLEGQQRNFELSADGLRFLMVRNLPPPAEIPAVVLVQNWFSELPR